MRQRRMDSRSCRPVSGERVDASRYAGVTPAEIGLDRRGKVSQVSREVQKHLHFVAAAQRHRQIAPELPVGNPTTPSLGNVLRNAPRGTTHLTAQLVTLKLGEVTAQTVNLESQSIRVAVEIQITKRAQHRPSSSSWLSSSPSNFGLQLRLSTLSFRPSVFNFDLQPSAFDVQPLAFSLQNPLLR